MVAQGENRGGLSVGVTTIWGMPQIIGFHFHSNLKFLNSNPDQG